MNWGEGLDILAIVGSTRFTCPKGIRIASDIISATLNARRPDIICSGGSPYGGVDALAQVAARGRRIEFVPFPPAHRLWTHPHGGFKQRNDELAGYCTRLLRIHCWHTRACTHRRTYGSGYTADVAEALGKSVRRRGIDPDGNIITDAPAPEGAQGVLL